MGGSDHLTKEFFKGILEADNLKSLYLSNGCSGGDNFSSKVYRAVVNYKKDNIKETSSLIVKCISYEGERAFLQTMDIYGTEIGFYKEIVPKMEHVLKEKIAPTYYFSTENPMRTIVFEDLVEKGFEIADRLKGLNFEQSKLVIQKLARFHAGSAIIIQNNPELSDIYSTHMFHNVADHPLVVDEMFLKNFEYLIELVDVWEDYSSIATKLRKLKDNFMEHANKVITRNMDQFNVINHGDCWVNNFMFKMNGRKPVDVLFIDLQMCYYGSPGLDINYFLTTSIQLEVLQTKRYELIHHYYSELKTTLEMHNYRNPPSYEAITRTLYQTEFYAIWALECAFPLISMDPAAPTDNSFDLLSDSTAVEDRRKISFHSKRFTTTAKYLLDRWNELGVLD